MLQINGKCSSTCNLMEWAGWCNITNISLSLNFLSGKKNQYKLALQEKNIFINASHKACGQIVSFAACIHLLLFNLLTMVASYSLFFSKINSSKSSVILCPCSFLGKSFSFPFFFAGFYMVLKSKTSLVAIRTGFLLFSLTPTNSHSTPPQFSNYVLIINNSLYRARWTLQNSLRRNFLASVANV